ncbi:MAG: methyl-accepting chemotaxis protein [Pseudomonadota bacterium]
MSFLTRFLYNIRIWIRLSALVWLLLVLAWTGLIGWAVYEQRSVALNQAEDFAHSMHQSTMAGLTTMMITGTMDKRDHFLSQIEELGTIRDLRVLRGDAVARQFGEGSEDEQAQDDLEMRVLESGESHVATEEDGDVLRAIIPTHNSSDYLGKNCMQCHAMAEEGEVLGAVSMRMSLDEVNESVSGFALNTFLVAVLISLPFVGLVWYFVTRFVSRPLQEMTHGMNEVASGGGDLTRRLPVRGSDEIGEASSAFNRVMETFGDLVKRVTGSVERLGQATDELNRVSQATEKAGGEQRNETEQAATAMNEMVASSQEVARNAQQAAESVGESSEHAEQGATVVRESVERIEKLAEEVRRGAEAITELETKSADIGRVMGVIRDIADQTNLLALNAAIEAARAGEAGRGFAVVADEVRNLAQRSEGSTHEIDEHVESLQQGIRDAVSIMEASREQAQSAVEQAEAAGEALQAITDSVATISDMNSQIASAAEEQTSVAEEINRNVATVSDKADETAGYAEQSNTAGLELAQIAEELQELVARFKV